MDRRRFVGLCAGTAVALATGARRVSAVSMRDCPPAKLVDANGVPLRASSLTRAQAYVFHYPFRAVPCFLIKLGQARVAGPLTDGEGGDRRLAGDAGERHQLVSYVAVCTHQLSYASTAASVIRYAADDSELAGTPGMIVCCAHGSVFDPAAGARMVSGPADQPLIPIRLEFDPLDDSVTATGIGESTLIDRFFAAYKSDLIVEYGPGAYRQPVGETTTAMLLDQFSAIVPSC